MLLTRVGVGRPGATVCVAVRREGSLPRVVARSRCRATDRRSGRGREGRVLAAESDVSTPVQPRDDDVLPDNLADSLFQASDATTLAIDRGNTRCVVELLLPEFWDPMSGPVFSDEGDNMRFWKLTRRFIDNLAAQLPSKQINALFPDMGVAVMLQNLWTDADFRISCVTSKAAVRPEDDVVVFAAPDPQSFEACRRIVDGLENEKTVVLFNPRLSRSDIRFPFHISEARCSGDVGVGLNVRRLRETFLGPFVTVYSLRPIEEIGSVFRRFPEPWLVFVADAEMPGRYKRIAERSSRPAGDVLDAILRQALGGDDEKSDQSPSLMETVTLPLRSLQRFMKSLM